MANKIIRLVAELNWAWVAILGIVVAAGQASSQEAKPRSLIRAGYTRPGSPDDPVKDGKVLPLALQPDYKGKLLGGTVYFGVYERTGSETWDTGLKDLNDHFVAGKNMQNNFSPKLDTRARYLYLYQVVNDRGLDPREIMLALTVDPKAGDIGGFGLKLPVDPKHITSWGHFKNAAFSVMVPDRPVGSVIKQAGEGKAPEIRLAVSASGAVLSKLPVQRYQARSPAHSLMDLRNSFAVNLGTLNLKESQSYQMLLKKKDKGTAMVGSEANFLKAAEAALEPEFAQIMPKTDKEAAEFRVLWGANAMKLGQHSVVFGFTSDLPPSEETAQIEAAEAFKGNAARPVETGDGFAAQGVMPAPQAPMQVVAGGKARTPVRAGYTRPGYLPDEITNEGKIKPMAFVAKQKIIGGTVYFAVFERTGQAAEGDVWNTGLGNLQEMFSEGYSFQGTFSPALDTRGRYLYLYQIVNDRGLDRGEGAIAPAIDDRKELNTLDIAGYALRLSVDPRYLTSWGYFKNAAFTVQVPNRTFGGDVVPAADGTDAKLTLAVSSYQPVLSELPEKRYTSRSPAFPLPSAMVSMFGVGSATLNLKMADDHRYLARMQADGTKLVSYEKNKMQAAVAARHPDFVQVLYGEPETGLAAWSIEPALKNPDIAPVVFRADFRKGIKAGEHSVVFGFTTDLPPQDEPIRIEAPVVGREGSAPMTSIPAKEKGIQFVSLEALQEPAAGSGIVPAAGSGIAPGPIQPVAQGGGGGSLGTLGGISGGMGGGFGGGMGGGFGGLGARGAGSIGSAPASTGGGGGGISATGTPSSTQGTTNQAQTATPNNVINFNATLTNQQIQLQLQLQQQLQQQQQQGAGGTAGTAGPQSQSSGSTSGGTNSGSGGSPTPGTQSGPQSGNLAGNLAENATQTMSSSGGNVVPEPGSLLLTLLGLPGLAWYYRRNKVVAA